MQCPFPGMDPYLERADLWPDVHTSLIAAIRDALAPQLAPRYTVHVEERMYTLLRAAPLAGRADVAVQVREPAAEVLEVDVPLEEEIVERYLEVHEARQGRLVTMVEILSPANKIGAGRRKYLRKRERILETLTHLVEIDLLRAGAPMSVSRKVESAYRLLISRGDTRPRARLYLFGVRQPIPSFPLPLLPGDAEPLVNLNDLLHSLYTRARYDLRVDYTRPPDPSLNDADAAWARERLAALQA